MKPKTPMWQLVANEWQKTQTLVGLYGVDIVKGSFSLDNRTNVFTMELECRQCKRHWRAYRARIEGFLNSDATHCPWKCNAA